MLLEAQEKGLKEKTCKGASHQFWAVNDPSNVDNAEMETDMRTMHMSGINLTNSIYYISYIVIYIIAIDIDWSFKNP